MAAAYTSVAHVRQRENVASENWRLIEIAERWLRMTHVCKCKKKIAFSDSRIRLNEYI